MRTADASQKTGIPGSAMHTEERRLSAKHAHGIIARGMRPQTLKPPSPHARPFFRWGLFGLRVSFSVVWVWARVAAAATVSSATRSSGLCHARASQRLTQRLARRARARDATTDTPTGQWLELLLTEEARALFLERGMFVNAEPRIVDGGHAVATTAAAAAAAGAGAGAETAAPAPTADDEDGLLSDQLAPAAADDMATDAQGDAGSAAAAAADDTASSATATASTSAAATATATAPAPTAAPALEEEKRPVICCDLRLVDQLALAVMPESWGMYNWSLQSLLRETFGRLLQQGRIIAFYPTGSNDPTALAFHTGVVTPTAVPIYALVVPTVSRVRRPRGAPTIWSSTPAPRRARMLTWPSDDVRLFPPPPLSLSSRASVGHCAQLDEGRAVDDHQLLR